MNKTKQTPKQERRQARRAKSKRNALPRGVIGEVAMPTQHDITYLGRQKLPPPTDRRYMRDLQQVFTLEVRSTLAKPEVAHYFGGRVSSQHLASVSLEAQRAEAVRVRMEHGVEIATRIAASFQVELYEGVGNLMRDWDDFALRFPQAADRLEPLREWWEATHPRGTKPAQNDEPTPEPVHKPA